MIMDKHMLWEEGEYNYPVLETFRPNLRSYIHYDGEVHPAIIVIPGGAYCYCSASEGELVAKAVFSYGYNVFVLSYTTDFLMREPLKLQPLKDLSRAMVFVRKNAGAFETDPNRIAVMGFSAGGHLAASIAVHFDEPALLEEGNYKGISNRPDAVLLSYPVITMGEYTHENSRTALCGTNATTEELNYMSLENHVEENTPPVFLWHCKTDSSVPVENSNLFYNACKEKNVPAIIKIFDHGKHGMSLATEEWANAPLYGTYTLEQFFEALRYLHENDMELPDPIKGKMVPKGADIVDFYIDAKNESRIHEHGEEEIATWVEMAFEWLDGIFAG